MKKFLFIFSIIFLVSCSSKNIENSDTSYSLVDSKIESTSNSNEENKKNRLEYAYDFIDGYKRDNSLYVDRMLGDYPNNLKSDKNSPYEKNELKNLDYNKNLSISMYNIRIPERALVFSNDKSFIVDFPKSKNYDISIKIDKLFKDGEYKESELNNKLIEFSSKKTIEEAKNTKVISQATINIKSDYKNATYSIIEDNKFSYTNIFLATPTNILKLEIVENKEKSQLSPYIMTDLLSTAYPESEDVPVVSKSFKNYKDKINLYATEKVDMGDFSFKIPSNMKNTQKSKSLTVFENQISGKSINQILVAKVEKKGKITIKDAFNEIQGTAIAPSYISPMGKVIEEKSKNKTFLKSKVRIYTEQFSLEGEKIVFEQKNSFIVMILTGPLNNTSSTDLLNNNIINSLEFKK